jgi:hypothetical protein
MQFVPNDSLGRLISALPPSLSLKRRKGKEMKQILVLGEEAGGKVEADFMGNIHPLLLLL